MHSERGKTPVEGECSMEGQWPKSGTRVAIIFLLSSSTCIAQITTIEPAARAGIDAGNQAWIDGMKQGQSAPIAATYVEDAVDCAASGECVRGRAAIEKHIKEQITKFGHAVSAAVTSTGAVQQGDFVYEWGVAEASFASQKKLVDRYLTVWQRQSDGWKIFRNLVIPDSPAH